VVCRGLLHPIALFIAGLELAKQGEVALAQADQFESIHVSQAPVDAPT